VASDVAEIRAAEIRTPRGRSRSSGNQEQHAETASGSHGAEMSAAEGENQDVGRSSSPAARSDDRNRERHRTEQKSVWWKAKIGTPDQHRT
jgi:hypothetical protein